MVHARWQPPTQRAEVKAAVNTLGRVATHARYSA
jgi:hypothetical protein